MIKRRNGATAQRHNGIKPDNEDLSLERRIEEFFRAERDMFAVKSDPDYGKADALAREMIADHMAGSPGEERKQFILSSLSQTKEPGNKENEISGIMEEIRSQNLDDLTNKWIDDWEVEKQQGDKRTSEIREFVIKSLSESGEMKEQLLSVWKTVPAERKRIIRYIAGAAAIFTGLIITYTTLFLSGNPQKLYTRYYEPVTAVSPVTRDASAGNEGVLWIPAVTSFNQGDYDRALELFTAISASGPSLTPPRFYSGLSHLALGNTGEAVRILEDVMISKGEFTKEATWYLGLACLKEGNYKKASECFTTLAGQPGYYSERSARILRRLK